MFDERPTHKQQLQGILRQGGGPTDSDGGEGACAAFGYLRGIKDSAYSIEFRFSDGNSTWFPYSWLGNWTFNPSEGLLLKFSGDLVYLVLIRGSNLDKPLPEGSVNLTRAGLQRQRVIWLREMSEDDIRSIGEDGPTIDRIEVAQFESHQELKDWLSERAPGFLH
jgi:hypothetical protein